MDDIRDVMVKIDINSSILERKIKRLARELDDMADDRRIIKGWTNEEREDLEKSIKADYSLMDIFNRTITVNGTALNKKYCSLFTDDAETQLANDIADYFNDDAKFPVEKWYVHFVVNDSFSYLNRGLESKDIYLGSKGRIDCIQTQFTKQEVEDINPDYLLFLEKVPDEELED